MAVKFTSDHEWIRMENETTGVVGITDYAQEQLGELVFVELPEVGRQVTKGEDSAVIESVKAASELHAPVTGAVLEVNSELEEAPELVNQDPNGKGWFYRIEVSDAAELESLLDETAYQASLD
ncbi:MAG: glycine cleavage system protein GcvH [Gammaproteobacteria bacterium]|nr:glycine cleavage system protein GcvH [Gammaproteobacteria bacterium]